MHWSVDLEGREHSRQMNKTETAQLGQELKETAQVTNGTMHGTKWPLWRWHSKAKGQKSLHAWPVRPLQGRGLGRQQVRFTATGAAPSLGWQRRNKKIWTTEIEREGSASERAHTSGVGLAFMLSDQLIALTRSIQRVCSSARLQPKSIMQEVLHKYIPRGKQQLTNELQRKWRHSDTTTDRLERPVN